MEELEGSRRSPVRWQHAAHRADKGRRGGGGLAGDFRFHRGHCASAQPLYRRVRPHPERCPSAEQLDHQVWTDYGIDRRVKLVVLTPRGSRTKAKQLERMYIPPRELLDLDLNDLVTLRSAVAKLSHPPARPPDSTT